MKARLAPRAAHLHVASRHVDTKRIAGDVGHGLVLGDVPASLPNDHAELDCDGEGGAYSQSE